MNVPVPSNTQLYTLLASLKTLRISVVLPIVANKNLCKVSVINERILSEKNSLEANFETKIDAPS